MFQDRNGILESREKEVVNRFLSTTNERILFMKKYLFMFFISALSIPLWFSSTAAQAAKKETKWDYDKQITETKGAFTYHAYISKNKKNAWIYKIDIHEEKEHSVLSIPELLDGKIVTRLGYTMDAEKEPDVDYILNLFGTPVEDYHNWDGSSEEINDIKTLIIPDSVNKIQSAAFSGMDSLKTITLPDDVKTIESILFYGCGQLKTVQLPKKLKKLNANAFRDCPKLRSLKLSSKNKTYQIKKQCVIKKKSKTLTYVLPFGKKVDIPDGVKKIKTYAFNNCISPAVDIPASVTEIEFAAFHQTRSKQNIKIKNISVSGKNKVYAKDGQCIYNKKNKSLSVAIVNNKGTLKISDKVKNLTYTYSMVNCDTEEKSLKKVVFPKYLKTVSVPAFSLLSEAKKVYFTGKKPPKIKNEIEYYSSLPIFTDVYVPSSSEADYREWYEKYNCDDSVYHWYTHK